jgi:hypothetical protein
MVEHLEDRILFAYPVGPEWDPYEDTPPGTSVYHWMAGSPGDHANASWSVDPNDAIFQGGQYPVLTLTNVPPHSEIRALADMNILDAERDEFDLTWDGGFLSLNGAAPVTDTFARGSGARMNSGLRPNGGGNTVTVEIGPHDTEVGEWVAFRDVEVFIWTPTLTIQHPPSLSEGQSGSVVIHRTGGDHGLFAIPVSLAKVEVFGPNQATSSDWTLETSVTIGPGAPGTSVIAPISIVDDPTYEPQEAANYRVLPSNIHTLGGTTQQPSGNRTFNINPSDYNPYGGGGYGGGGGGGFAPQGAFSDDAIEDDAEYVGDLVDAVAGDLVGVVVA